MLYSFCFVRILITPLFFAREAEMVERTWGAFEYKGAIRKERQIVAIGTDLSNPHFQSSDMCGLKFDANTFLLVLFVQCLLCLNQWFIVCLEV